MAKVLTDNQHYTNIANSIRAKLGVETLYKPSEMSAAIDSIGGEKVEKTIDPDFSEGNIEVIPEEGTFLAKVTVNKPETLVPENIAKDVVVAGIKGTCEGGGSTIPTLSTNEDAWIDDICFWDIDGTLIQQIKVEEAASLEELPTPPTKTNLTFVGWNYTLEEIKTLGRPLDVGAVYDTVDGKIYLTLNISNSSYKAVPIHFSQSIANGITINWGDGSTSQSATAGVTSLTHTYSSTGTKNIIITVADGCELTLGGGTSSTVFVGGGTSNYRDYLTKVLIPSGVKLNPYCFYSCRYACLSLPPDLTDVPDYAFYGIYLSLWFRIIPPNVKTLGERSCYKTVGYYSKQRTYCVISLPESVETIGQYGLNDNNYMKRIIFPTKLIDIPIRCCQYCYMVRKIILPPNLKSIGDYAFCQLRSLRTIELPEGLETIGQYAFNKCYSLREMIIPKGVTTLGTYLFSECYSLQKLVIPEGVTTIPNHMLYECWSLSELKLPKSLTTIGDHFLYKNAGLTELDLPENVTTIGQYFCGYARGIQRIIIRSVITTLGHYPLSSADSLMEIIFLANTTNSNMHGSLYTSYYVPDDALSNFKSVFSSDYDYGINPLSAYGGVIPEG